MGMTLGELGPETGCFSPEKCWVSDFSKPPIPSNMVKTVINHPIFDGLYQPFVVILGMVNMALFLPHETTIL